jgi:hypothetical protein
VESYCPIQRHPLECRNQRLNLIQRLLRCGTIRPDLRIHIDQLGGPREAGLEGEI